MERSEGGDYEAGGEAVARTRPKGPSERSVTVQLLGRCMLDVLSYA
ncbi:hypothetical protein N8703_01485 [Verrucomicrobia bacterium]|nr:hypothetical protein [Verrucomicrobiota bacterium]